MANLSRKLRSLAQVEEWVQTHGDVQGVRLYIHDKITTFREAREMVELLSDKEENKRWVVVRLEKLQKVVAIDDALSTANTLISDAIRLTSPARRHVWGPIRVSRIAYASGRRRRRRRSDRAVLPAGSSGSDSSSTPRARRRAGRRHVLPRIVPVVHAQKIIDAGRILEEKLFFPVRELGEPVSDVGFALLRQSKDKAALHEQLLKVEAKMAAVWDAEFKLTDLDLDV